MLEVHLQRELDRPAVPDARVLARRAIARARHVAHDPIVAAFLAPLAPFAARTAARQLRHALSGVATHKQLATQLAQRRAPGLG